MNVIGRAFAVCGHYLTDPAEATKGMVLATTCTGWATNLNTFNERLRKQSDGYEPKQLHLMMYEDGKVHWEDLMDDSGPYQFRLITPRLPTD